MICSVLLRPGVQDRRFDELVQKCSHSEQQQGEVATTQSSTSQWSVSLFTLCHLVLVFCGQVDDLPRITASTKGQGCTCRRRGKEILTRSQCCFASVRCEGNEASITLSSLLMRPVSYESLVSTAKPLKRLPLAGLARRVPWELGECWRNWRMKKIEFLRFCAKLPCYHHGCLHKKVRASRMCVAACACVCVSVALMPP